jgi:hypothetical protein
MWPSSAISTSSGGGRGTGTATVAARFTPQELARLWRNQRGRCALSGRPLGRDAHLDHILPKALGGISRLPNLRWLDPQVNVARQHLSDEDFALLCAQVVEVIGRQLLASIERAA